MADPLLDPLLARIARASRAGMRLGSVTVIDAADASLTVNCAGDVITGVRWIGSYAPVVADVVVVSRVGAFWVVLGKLSKQLGGPTTLFGSVTATPATTWAGRYALGEWYWAVDTGGQIGQGVHEPYYMVVEQLTGAWYIPSVVSVLPAGATVTAAKLRLTRWIAPAEGEGITPESTLVTPRLRMHAYSVAPTAAPAWTGSAWAPGTLTAGQPGVWDLPSTWLTALLAGTAKGVGVYSTAYADHTYFSGAQIELSYSVPA